jgi:hypothetical protein
VREGSQLDICMECACTNIGEAFGKLGIAVKQATEALKQLTEILHF